MTPGQIITCYSYKGGVGRTMALANIAWILASTGRRVLTIDWDLESPGLHRYFAPFLHDRNLRGTPGVVDALMDYANSALRGDGPPEGDALRELSDISRYATSLEGYVFPSGGLIDFVPAGRQSPEYSTVVSTFDWSVFWDRLDGERFLDAWATNMRENYDITLIDSRTGLSDSAGICTVQLPDTVVAFFTLSNQSIEGAAAVAGSIRAQSAQRGRTVRLFPVPTRVEDGEARKLDRGRAFAHQRFSAVVSDLGLSDPAKYWGAIEIPYRVYYAYEEVLAFFGDRPHQENAVLAAFQRLTEELIGEPCDVDGPSDVDRQRWLRAFERQDPVVSATVMIGYVPRDRIWAEWIAGQLRTLGQRTVLQNVGTPDSIDALAGADRVLVLLSQESVRRRE